MRPGMGIHRDLLDREIGTPPPSTIDIDSLITSERRRVRLRRTGLGGIGVTTVLLIFAGYLFVPTGGGMNEDIDVGVSASASSASAPPKATSRAAEAARLTAALQGLISQALPGATLSKAPAPRQGDLPADPLVFVDFGNYFVAEAVITDAQGSGTLRVSVGKEDTQFRADHECTSDPAPLDVHYTCEVKPVADGSLLQASSQIGDDNFLRFYIELMRADGNAVSVDVSNGVIAGGDPYHSQRPQPLLSIDQAAALAQDPTLATTL